MYPIDKLEALPLNTPLLMKFRKNMENDKEAKNMDSPPKAVELLMVCEIWQSITMANYPIVDVIALDWSTEILPGTGNPGPPGSGKSLAGVIYRFLTNLPNKITPVRMKPNYLQTVEPFPLEDFPLLLGWKARYPRFKELLTDGHTTTEA